MDFLGAPLAQWLGFVVLGAAFGLALDVTAKPQGAALPVWFPKLRSNALAHATYGALVGLVGVVFVTLGNQALGILYRALGEGAAAALVLLWGGIVTWAAMTGAEGSKRRVIRDAHARVLGALALFLVLGVILARLSVFRGL